MRAFRLVLLVSLVIALAFGLAGCQALTQPNPGGDSSGSGTKGDPVKVTLSWEDPVDMDLEIWNSSGEEALFAASSFGGRDVEDGEEGDEFFEFKKYGDEDYTAGKYVISVFFAGSGDESITQADVKITIRMPDGSEETRNGTVYWEEGRDQWHGFRVDAATGDIEDIDEIVEVEVEE